MAEKEELLADIDELKLIKKDLTEKIMELDDRVLYQNFGIYQPQYNFATLDNYKNRLDDVRNEQKKLIANKIGRAHV